MQVRVIALGHRMPAWVAAGWEDYARRMPRELALTLIELKPEPRHQGKTVTQILDAEAERIGHAAKGARLVALDEHGKPWTTRDLANHLARCRDEATDTAFVIGSADGLAPSVKAGAAAVVSLSAMTLPHAMVRVIIAEQLYRAVSLLSGHPYHRD